MAIAASCAGSVAQAQGQAQSQPQPSAASNVGNKFTGYTTPAKVLARNMEPTTAQAAGAVPAASPTPWKKSVERKRGVKKKIALAKGGKTAKTKPVAARSAKPVNKTGRSIAKAAKSPRRVSKPPAPMGKGPPPARLPVAQSRPPSAGVPQVTPPTLKVDAGAIKPISGTAGSSELAVQPKSFSPWVGMLPLALMLGGVYVWARRRDESPELAVPPVLQDPVLNLDPGDVATSSAIIKADLLRSAEPFYRDLRLASSRKDHDFFYQHCTEDLATSMILDSETANDPGTAQVDSLKAELVDLFEEVNRYVASVQYTANVQLGNTQPRKVRELWHFVREPNAESWRLAAVEST